MSVTMLQRVRATVPFWIAPRQMLYYVGCLGLDNLGDDMMLPIYRGLFPQWPTAYLRPCGPFRWQRAIEFRSARAAILGGGTILGGYPTHPVHRRFAHAVKQYGNGIVFGTGVVGASPDGMTESEAPKLQSWLPMLHGCRYVGVRGPYSSAALRQRGIDAEIIGDPVCQLVSTPSLASPRRTLGVNVGLIHNRDFLQRESLLESLSVLIRHYHRTGIDVEFFVVRPGDLPITRELMHLAHASDAKVHAIYHSASEFQAACGGLSGFVGMKLHATALSLAAGVPSLGIAYEVKCHDFMHSVGMNSFSVEMTEATTELLLDRVDRLLVEGCEIVRRALRLMEDFAALQRRRATDLASAVLGERDWTLIRSPSL